MIWIILLVFFFKQFYCTFLVVEQLRFFTEEYVEQEIQENIESTLKNICKYFSQLPQ